MNIEGVLNELEYKGSKLGGLFANVLYSSLYLHGYEFTVLNGIRVYLQFVKLEVVSFFNWGSRKRYTHRKYIFNYTANMKKLTEFFSPLLAHIPADDILFVSKKGHHFQGDKDLSLYSPTLLTFREWIEWRREFKPVLAKFKQLRPVLSRKFNIHGSLYFYLKITIKYQTQRLYLFNKLLADVKPDIILTDHDRQAINSALIIAGQLNHIPTYTFIHGSTDPEANFLPLIADNMLCWGQKHVNQFLNFGIHQDHLLKVGNPRLHRTAPQKEQITDKILVSFISNPIDIHERLILANIFGEAMDKLHQINPAITGIIKLHPNETKEAYGKVAHKYEHMTILSSVEMDNLTLFNTSTIIVSHNSTMSFDALVAGKRVVILNPPDVHFPLGIGEDMISIGGCPEATNTQTLAEAVLETIEHIRNGSQNEMAEAYINYYCQYWGDDAAKKIVETISQHTHT
jgi:hypothetical protein